MTEFNQSHCQHNIHSLTLYRGLPSHKEEKLRRVSHSPLAFSILHDVSCAGKGGERATDFYNLEYLTCCQKETTSTTTATTTTITKTFC